MFVNGSGRNEQSFTEDITKMLPTKFRFIWQWAVLNKMAPTAIAV